MLTKVTLALASALLGVSTPTAYAQKSPDSAKSVATRVAEFAESDDVASLEFSPNGAQLAVDTAVELPIHIWEWNGSARLVRTLSKPPGTGDFLFSVNGIRYSPDGKFLAVAHKIARDQDGHGVVRIFDAASGAIVHDIGELRSGGTRTRIAYSPDGKYFVRTFDRFPQFPGDNLIVQRADNWEAIWGLRTVPLDIMSFALSADGKLAAVAGMIVGPGLASRSPIWIIDLAQHGVVKKIDDAFPENNTIEALAFSTDGIRIAAGVRTGEFAGAVRVFDVRTGEQVAEERPTELGGVVGLRYTGDGKYLIESGVRHSVEIWDAQHQRLLQEIDGVNSTANIAVSRDSRYFAFDNHKKVQVWQLH